MIVYTCHQCKAQLQSPDSMSGSFITCPSCKSTLIVPGAAYRPASAPTTTTDAPAVALTSPAPTPASTNPAPTPPPIPAISPAAFESPAPTPAAAFSSPAASPATGAYVPVTPPPTPPSPSMPPPPPPFGATMYPPGVYPAGRPARVSRLIYVVLAIFLGSFGVHNFAAGYNNTAIIQLVVSIVGFLLAFCTFGITGLAPLAMYVWAIVEAATVTKDADGITMP